MYALQHPDNLFVYDYDGRGDERGRAVGLRGTNHSRYDRSGATVLMWLRVRGDTCRLRST